MNESKQLLSSLNWRYAVKKFDASKKVSAEDWATLEESLRLTPSSYGLQPWRFLIIQDPTTRKRLREAAWNQTQVEDCSHFIVFTAKTGLAQTDIDKFLDSVAITRSIPKDSLNGYRGMMEGDLINGQRSQMIPEWTARQTYIALGNLMTSAALLGIDTCPMEGLDPAKFDEILSLPGSGYRTVMACAVGYRSPEDKYSTAAKVRYGKESVIELR